MKSTEQVPSAGHSRAMTIGILIILIGCIAAVVTTVFINRSDSEFLLEQRDRFVAGEIAVSIILAVEISSRMIINRLTKRNVRQTGIAIRSVLRVICYLIIAVVILWMLSDNPSLAISVGTITVVGITGKVTDITLLYTVIDNSDGSVFIPNTAVMSSAIQHRKEEHL